MAEEKMERYEFSFDERINGGGKEGLKGFVFDALPKGDKLMIGSKKPCIILMSDDQSTAEKEIGHSPFGYIEFEDPENFELAMMALELLRHAIYRDADLKESD